MTLHDLLKPELRLFMSVDVQDSTAFKQQADERDSAPWRGFFGAFFRDFPNELEKQLPANARQPQPWKFLGDEIIFSLLLEKPMDALFALRAFRNAVVSYDPALEKPRQLRLKGSAWLAGFPAGNVILPGRKKADSSVHYSSDDCDYIGPSMDTGFRLGKIATRRKLAISVELAWWLLQLPGSRQRDLPLYFEGRCAMKGVMELDGYPFIWTDLFHVRQSALMKTEDALKRLPTVPRSRLKAFCRSYIQEHGEPRWVPFIKETFDKRTPTEKRLYKIEFEKAQSTVNRLYPELSLSEVTVTHTRLTSSDRSALAQFEKLMGSHLTKSLVKRERAKPAPNKSAAHHRRQR